MTQQAAQALCGAGADVNAKDHMGRTPLHTAAFHDVSNALLHAGADPNAVDHAGETPMHTVARGTDRGWVNLLLAAGADVNLRNKRGEKPEEVADPAVRSIFTVPAR